MTKQLNFLPLLSLLLLMTACKVEWGGARMAFESPAPPVGAAAEGSPAAAGVIAPLPAGPLLYRVQVDQAGTGVLVPIARLTDSVPSALELPAKFSQSYRARFDSAFLRPGTELAFLSDGNRVGSLLIGGERSVWNPGCPSAAHATALLVNGQALPVAGFAALPAGWDPAPRPTRIQEPDRRIRTFGPILAENLLKEAGVERAYLAQRAAMKAVRFEGDTTPAFAATYVVGDSLAAGAPLDTREALSLFYLARYDPTRGYFPVWKELHRYDAPHDRAVLEYVDWFEGSGGRLDFVRVFGDGTERLAVSLQRASGQRQLDWEETDRCQSAAAFSAAWGDTTSVTPDAAPAGP